MNKVRAVHQSLYNPIAQNPQQSMAQQSMADTVAGGCQAALAHFLKRNPIMPEGQHSHILLQESAEVRVKLLVGSLAVHLQQTVVLC